MNKSDFFYELPKELIAQHPTDRRDDSRLMCLERRSGAVSAHLFHDLPQLLKTGDVLVVNDSRVIPARLVGHKSTGAECEILLLRDMGNDCWQALVRPGKRLHSGAKVNFGIMTATVADELEDGKRLVSFDYDHKRDFYSLLDELGTMPLPPYITERLDNGERYQTVYAEHLGSAAAPTAGLHFTKELLSVLENMGVEIVHITLHVGLGTFRPVKEDDITKHIMHDERYWVSEDAAKKISLAKQQGRRIIAVGTTSCRTLESVMQRHGAIVPCSESTDIFIYPGYEFRAIDGLITNFHLPESTLIMLVSAFAGYDHVMAAYREAVEQKYRFFSFGDAMLIL